ncbi:hypothetical protein BC938DRAFT_480324 [Jimgerdemannia flammicorona]|uniref:Uncharacterized protein n=1 Tax=Jimgerdemannia flammicorona TaxID=994334 RepID=A0A433QXK6_9FUNG|nr:hypothetical protein BC938DRAFT_480324 [Jimgerdemannia flammicorona]
MVTCGTKCSALDFLLLDIFPDDALIINLWRAGTSARSRFFTAEYFPEDALIINSWRALSIRGYPRLDLPVPRPRKGNKRGEESEVMQSWHCDDILATFRANASYQK